MRFYVILSSFLFFSGKVLGQGFSFNCTRDTLIPGCPANLCITLKGVIPDLHGLSDSYFINPTSPNTGCFPVYTQPDDPAGTPTFLVIDDRYTGVINIGFPFPFYGTTYNTLIASTNGLVSFDVSKANGSAHYAINSDLPSTLYDRAIIMGPYHDLDPSIGSSPTQRIQYQVFGTAPYRRWVLSFFKVPLFSSSGVCDMLINNTHQIILYESTGVIEVAIFSKEICMAWQSGKAMVGLQDFSKTRAIMAPGRRASDPPWGNVGMNESWRFVPSGGPSLFKRVELYDLGGTLITTGTATNLGNGQLDVSFPNICVPPGTTTPFVIRSVYEKIDDPAVEVFGTDTVRINRISGLTGNASMTAASCGAANGTITVNGVTGGTAPYEYSLDGINWQSSNVFSSLSSGTYTINVRDASTLCTKDITINVPISGVLAASTNTTAASCTGVNNGTITVVSAAGTGPYNFSLDGGAPQMGLVPFIFSNISPGNHTVLVTQISSGCASNPLNVNVATGPGINASSSTTATSCPTASNGSIVVNALSGTAPFTYQLNAGAIQNGANTFTFSNLASGTYTVTVRDAVGCIRTINNVTVNAGPLLAANVVPATTSCNGASDGSIIITPINGTAPYEVSLDGSPFSGGTPPFLFNNLSVGSHTVAIRDIIGCLTTYNNINIIAGPVLTATTVQSATSCIGASNGTLSVTPNGAGPFEFAIDGGSFVSGTSPYTFSGLASGSHSILVRNAAGCVSGIISENVVAGPMLTTTINKTDVACFGGNTGVITVDQPTIGNPPYEYSLDNITWQSSNVFPGLIAGSYTVYYREGNGCQGSQLINILEPPAMQSSSSSVPAICNGQANGIITITASGGAGPYEYSIDGGTNWQNSNVFNKVAGSYTVIIRDVNGCTKPQTVSVAEPAVLSALSVNSNASCDGGNDGVINITATGGNSGYQYSIDNGVNWQNNNLFNVAPGSYTVEVKDNLGCTATFNTSVGLNNNLTFVAQADPTICESNSTQLELISNATQYEWSPRIALNDTAIFNPVANPVVTTQYVVKATLGRCAITDTVIVNVNAAPVPDAGSDGFICFGQTYTLQASGGVNYLWSPATYLNSTTVPNPVSSATKSLNYTLSIIADANGCKSIVTDDVRVDVTPPFRVNTYPFDTIGYPGDQFKLLAVADEPNATIFNWTPATRLSDSHIPNPMVTVGAIGEDVLYQVIASTIAGCKGEAYTRVKVYKGPEIYVPTGFTPNSDGKNDILIPFPVGIKSMKYFKVFNRWGQIVFSTNKLNEGWDGRLSGKEQPTGTYLWMIEVITNQDKTITKKGTVTLIR